MGAVALGIVFCWRNTCLLTVQRGTAQHSTAQRCSNVMTPLNQKQAPFFNLVGYTLSLFSPQRKPHFHPPNFCFPFLPHFILFHYDSCRSPALFFPYPT